MRIHKTIISLMYKLLHAFWYINLAMAVTAVAYQIFAMFNTGHKYFGSFLGSFKIEINSIGQLKMADGLEQKLYLGNSIGSPEVLFNTPMHGVYAIIFTLVISGIVLFYNYRFMHLFRVVDQGVKTNRHFSKVLVKHLKVLSIFSVVVFILASVLSILKVYLIAYIEQGDVIYTPIYDSGLLNFLWAAIVFYLLAGIFNVALNLQHDQELTI